MPKQKKHLPAAQKPTLNTLLTQWCTNNRVDPKKLILDNLPEGIMETFPLRSRQDLAEPLLADELWWWRHATIEASARIFHHPNVSHWNAIIFPIYIDHFQPSAHFYEFRSRYDDRYVWDFGQPYVFIRTEQRRMLGCLLPETTPAANWLPSSASQSQWANLHLKINLQLNDTVLEKQFRTAVEEARKKQRIAKPQLGQGIRRKPISWRAIEAMDIRHYGLRPLSDGERSQLAKAKKEYELTCSELGIAP